MNGCTSGDGTYAAGSQQDIGADSGCQCSGGTPGGQGYFAGWEGSGSGSYTGSSSSATVTMNGAISETATYDISDGLLYGCEEG